MEIAWVSVKNFKCFNAETRIQFEKITLLTGANSSGKSSIISSILTPLQSSKFPLDFITNGEYIEMGDFKSLIYNHNTQLEFNLNYGLKNAVFSELKSSWILDKKTNQPVLKFFSISGPQIEISLARSEGHYLASAITYESNEPARNEITEDVIRFLSESVISMSKITIKSKENKKKKYEEILSLDRSAINVAISGPENIRSLTRINKKYNPRFAYFISQLENVFPKQDESANFISSFRNSPERVYMEKSYKDDKIDKFGNGYLEQIAEWEISNPEKIKDLLRVLRKMKLVYGIKVFRLKGGLFEIQVRTSPNGPLSPLVDVGFGINQILPILVADMQLGDDSTLIMSQPEVHLHPSVQSTFGDYIIERITSTNKSYVIETHSEYLINKLRLHVAKNTVPASDISVYYFDNSNKDHKSYKINFNKNGSIENAPKTFFETYMMDVLDIALNS